MELHTSSVYAPGRGSSAVHLDQLLIAPNLGLLAAADAPGANADGRAGVRIALETVRTHVERNEDILMRFRRTPAPALRKRILAIIEEAFARAAQEIFAYARRRNGILITLDVLLLLEHEAFVGHVGDGRVYLVRRGLVHQLTVDHANNDDNEVFDRGETAETTIADNRRYTRSLGPQPRVRVETLCMELTHGDRFVVSTGHMPRVIPENILHTRFSSEHLDAMGPALVADCGGSGIAAATAQLGSGEPFTPDSAQSRLAILAPMPLFAHCNERELRAVAQSTRPRRFPDQTIIFEQGHPGTELFLLIPGSVDIIKDGKKIVTLGPGSNFGEMAMLDEPSRSASAVASDETELLVIPREAFFAMLKGNPMLAVKILWNMLLRLSAHLRSTSQRLADLESAD